MSVKILGGFARGLNLLVPKGDLIRPTSIMLKRRVFDFFQRMDDKIFIDLCAGSGAVGLEAWSRGARKVYLNEPHRHVLKILTENRELCLLKNHHRQIGEIVTSHLKAEQFLTQFKTTYLNLDDGDKSEVIIFLDPPYAEKNIYENIVESLQGDWFKGELWIESDRLKGIAHEEWGEKFHLEQIKLFTQGDSYIYVTHFN